MRHTIPHSRAPTEDEGIPAWGLREISSAPTGRKHMDTAATEVCAAPAAMRYRHPATGGWHRLYGGHRQSAVWVDLVCGPDQPAVSVGPSRHSTGLHDFYPHGDLARAD